VRRVPVRAKYNEPIVIERLHESVDLNDLGEVEFNDDDNWEPYFECFAAVFPRGTREFTRAGIVDADIEQMIDVPRCEETEGLTARMRILWNEAKLLVIAAFPKATDRREIEIHTRY